MSRGGAQVDAPQGIKLAEVNQGRLKQLSFNLRKLYDKFHYDISALVIAQAQSAKVKSKAKKKGKKKVGSQDKAARRLAQDKSSLKMYFQHASSSLDELADLVTSKKGVSCEVEQKYLSRMTTIICALYGSVEDPNPTFSSDSVLALNALSGFVGLLSDLVAEVSSTRIYTAADGGDLSIPLDSKTLHTITENQGFLRTFALPPGSGHLFSLRVRINDSCRYRVLTGGLNQGGGQDATSTDYVASNTCFVDLPITLDVVSSRHQGDISTTEAPKQRPEDRIDGVLTTQDRAGGVLIYLSKLFARSRFPKLLIAQETQSYAVKFDFEQPAVVGDVGDGVPSVVYTLFRGSAEAGSTPVTGCEVLRDGMPLDYNSDAFEKALKFMQEHFSIHIDRYHLRFLVHFFNNKFIPGVKCSVCVGDDVCEGNRTISFTIVGLEKISPLHLDTLDVCISLILGSPIYVHEDAATAKPVDSRYCAIYETLQKMPGLQLSYGRLVNDSEIIAEVRRCLGQEAVKSLLSTTAQRDINMGKEPHWILLHHDVIKDLEAGVLNAGEIVAKHFLPRPESVASEVRDAASLASLSVVEAGAGAAAVDTAPAADSASGEDARKAAGMSM